MEPTTSVYVLYIDNIACFYIVVLSGLFTPNIGGFAFLSKWYPLG